MSSELQEVAKEARAAIRRAIRIAHPCEGGHHYKAGHSDMACLRCGGTLVSRHGLELIEALEAELERALSPSENPRKKPNWVRVMQEKHKRMLKDADKRDDTDIHMPVADSVQYPGDTVDKKER